MILTLKSMDVDGDGGDTERSRREIEMAMGFDGRQTRMIDW